MDHRDRVRVLPRCLVLAASVKFTVSGHDLLRLDAYMEPPAPYRAVDDLPGRASDLQRVLAGLEDSSAERRMREALTHHYGVRVDTVMVVV